MLRIVLPVAVVVAAVGAFLATRPDPWNRAVVISGGIPVGQPAWLTDAEDWLRHVLGRDRPAATPIAHPLG